MTAGDKATQPDDPTRNGYEFQGWFLGDAEEAYDFDAPVTADLTLTAHWTAQTYTVSFDLGYDGADAPDDQTVEYGETATRPQDPTRDDYTFMGWHQKEDGQLATNVFDFATPITSDVELCAAWEPMPKRHLVVFETLGGSSVDAQLVADGETAERPSDPTRSDYLFADWFTEAGLQNVYDFSAPVTEDLTLYAKWESQYVTVSFDSMGGSAVASQTIIKGGHPSVPVNPERDGYVFSHWYLTDEADAYDFGKSVSSDITLKAAWTEVEPEPEPGTVTGVVKLEDGWELTSNNMDAVAEATLDDDERAAVTSGANAVLTLVVSPLESVPDPARTAVDSLLEDLGATEGSWNDLSSS